MASHGQARKFTPETQTDEEHLRWLCQMGYFRAEDFEILTRVLDRYEAELLRLRKMVI